MFTGPLALALSLIGSPIATPRDADAPPILPHAQLSTELGALAAAHPDLVQRQSIGNSLEGRAIELVRLQGEGAGESTARPAILLVAGLSGPRLYESGVVLEHARRLAAGYGQDEAVTRLLDSTTVYLLPRANPDPAEARFATPRAERETSGRDVDNDRDGRLGEDEPQDIDGDGLLNWMRVLDPEGTWIADPTDARALIEADSKKGQRGLWKLYREGRDLDGDELVAEDPAADTILNRSFPAGWDELAPDAGLFPGDEPEALALMDFVVQHPELAMIVVYDGLDNLVKDTKAVADDAPSVKRIPPPGWLQSDADLLKEIGARYKKLVPQAVEGATEDGGSFQRWCYEHRGLWTLSLRLWDLPKEAPKAGESEAAQDPAASDGDGQREGEGEGAAEAGSERESVAPAEPPPAGEETGAQSEPAAETEAGAKGAAPEQPKPCDDAKQLQWIDASEGEAWRFQDWTPFEHPELGTVEIGGFTPYARLEPPAARGRELADQHYAFFLTLGELLPRVSLVEFESERLGVGLWRVEAVVESGSSLLPLRSRSARRTETVRPARVHLTVPEGAALIAGREQELLRELAGAGGRSEFTWLVSGPEGMNVSLEIDTDNAGVVSRAMEVK